MTGHRGGSYSRLSSARNRLMPRGTLAAGAKGQKGVNDILASPHKTIIKIGMLANRGIRLSELSATGADKKFVSAYQAYLKRLGR